MPIGTGSVIDEIAFRRDATVSASYGAVNGTVEVRMGATRSAEDPHAAPRLVLDEPQVEGLSENYLLRFLRD